MEKLEAYPVFKISTDVVEQNSVDSNVQDTVELATQLPGADDNNNVEVEHLDYRNNGPNEGAALFEHSTDILEPSEKQSEIPFAPAVMEPEQMAVVSGIVEMPQSEEVHDKVHVSKDTADCQVESPASDEPKSFVVEDEKQPEPGAGDNVSATELKDLQLENIKVPSSLATGMRVEEDVALETKNSPHELLEELKGDSLETASVTSASDTLAELGHIAVEAADCEFPVFEADPVKPEQLENTGKRVTSQSDEVDVPVYTSHSQVEPEADEPETVVAEEEEQPETGAEDNVSATAMELKDRQSEGSEKFIFQVTEMQDEQIVASSSEDLPQEPREELEGESVETASVTSASNTLADFDDFADEAADCQPPVFEADPVNPELETSVNAEAPKENPENLVDTSTYNFSSFDSPLVFNMTESSEKQSEVALDPAVMVPEQIENTSILEISQSDEVHDEVDVPVDTTDSQVEPEALEQPKSYAVEEQEQPEPGAGDSVSATELKDRQSEDGEKSAAAAQITIMQIDEVVGSVTENLPQEMLVELKGDSLETASITSASNTLADLDDIANEAADCQLPVFEAELQKSVGSEAAKFGVTEDLINSLTINLSSVHSPLVLNMDYEQPLAIPVAMQYLDPLNEDILPEACMPEPNLPDSYIQEISDSEYSTKKISDKVQKQEEAADKVPSEVGDAMDNIHSEADSEMPNRPYSNDIGEVSQVFNHAVSEVQVPAAGTQDPAVDLDANINLQPNLVTNIDDLSVESEAVQMIQDDDDDEATTASGTATVSRPSTAQSDSETCTSFSGSEVTGSFTAHDEVDTDSSTETDEKDHSVVDGPDEVPSIKSGTFEVTADAGTEDEVSDDSTSTSSEDEHQQETSVSNSEPVEPLMKKLDTYPVLKISTDAVEQNCKDSKEQDTIGLGARPSAADEGNNAEIGHVGNHSGNAFEHAAVSEHSTSTDVLQSPESMQQSEIPPKPYTMEAEQMAVVSDIGEIPQSDEVDVTVDIAYCHVEPEYSETPETFAVEEEEVSGTELKDLHTENSTLSSSQVTAMLVEGAVTSGTMNLPQELLVELKGDSLETASVTSGSNTLADFDDFADEAADCQPPVFEADPVNPELETSVNAEAPKENPENLVDTSTYNLSSFDSPLVFNMDYQQPLSIPVTMHFLDQASLLNEDILQEACMPEPNLPDSYIQEISDSENSANSEKVQKQQEASDKVPSEVGDVFNNSGANGEMPNRRYSNSLLTFQGVEALIDPQFLQEKFLAWQNQHQTSVDDFEEASQVITDDVPEVPVPAAEADTQDLAVNLDEDSNMTPKLTNDLHSYCTSELESVPEIQDDLARRLMIERQDCETVEIAHALIDAAIATGMLLTQETESTPFTDLQDVLVPDIIIQGNQHGLTPALMSANYQDSEPEGFEDDEETPLLEETTAVPEQDVNANDDENLKSAATSVEGLEASSDLLGNSVHDKAAQYAESATEFVPPSKQIQKEDFEWIDACTSSSELQPIAKPEVSGQKTGIDVVIQQDAIPTIPDTPKADSISPLQATKTEPRVDKISIFEKRSVLGAMFACFRKKNRVKNDSKK